ncbi:plasmid partitioning protein RepB [Brucella rhizosphaerae]|uniref:Plasmid partitioning protein RepB n=1 Tax=Brucella rhizosphaerae TaxID=571254 RepID=A0A256FQV7_9HYPH|nr:plasmid partitioning protein RepB [Brucella rhizosphaerae]OYR16821.1 plasmid partitioning protein RepB [Brucella rhizosphaerae]
MSKRRDALKDFLTPITATQEFSAENSFRRPQATSGALQSMNDAISGLSHEAEELRHALADGTLIVELDANDIDASFVKDRIEDFDSSDFEALLESIRDNGQAVPVLVRPYPDRAGRYQIAYGHRRVAALKKLGQKVKAFVRELSDDQLVIAQGNENLERKDLTFIEKAFFAMRLEDRGTSRAVIMSTFGTTSKGVLSEMISLARKLPDDVVQAIGAAPGVGRPKWESFANELSGGVTEKLKALFASPAFTSLKSADRFQLAFKTVQNKQKNRDPIHDGWSSTDQTVQVTAKSKSKTLALEFSSSEGKIFGEWLTNHLERLYVEYRQAKINSGE